MAKCNGPQWVSTDYHKYEVAIRETGPNCEDNFSIDCTEICCRFTNRIWNKWRSFRTVMKIAVTMQQACTIVNHKEDARQRNQRTKNDTMTHTLKHIWENQRKSVNMSMSTVNLLREVHITCSSQLFYNTKKKIRIVLKERTDMLPMMSTLSAYDLPKQTVFVLCELGTEC
jgi:hypothetical protein